MAFDAFSGSSGRWSFAAVSVAEDGCGILPLDTYVIDWTDIGSLSPDETITAWKITLNRRAKLESLTYDSPGNLMGVIFPEQRLSGIGGWSGTLSGICSTSGNFQVGAPVVCDFLFHKGAEVGRHNCHIIISSVEEFTAVTESTAKFSISFDGSGLLPCVTIGDEPCCTPPPPA